MIGYWLLQSIGNALPDRDVVAVIDQTLVDVDDPRLVVDKDLTAALLATELGADALVVLTDVPGVMREFGSPSAEVIAGSR